jgi:hypothetical protein
MIIDNSQVNTKDTICEKENTWFTTILMERSDHYSHYIENDVLNDNFSGTGD